MLIIYMQQWILDILTLEYKKHIFNLIGPKQALQIAKNVIYHAINC